jgi:hypothetical protein
MKTKKSRLQTFQPQRNTYNRTANNSHMRSIVCRKRPFPDDNIALYSVRPISPAAGGKRPDKQNGLWPYGLITIGLNGSKTD